MDAVLEFLEEDASEDVPVTVSVGAADVLGKVFQCLDIFRVRVHQVLVVIHRSGDKHIVLRVLSLLEFSVHEQPLHPAMTGAAWVAGQVNPLRDFVGAADDGVQAPELRLQELRCFVDEQPFVLLALVFALDCGAVARHVAELDLRPVPERDGVLRFVVLVDARREDL